MLNIPRIKQRVKYLYRVASPFDWIIAAGEMLRQAQHKVLFFSAQRQLLLLLLLFAASVSPAIAQVANDNIENRCVLQTGETVTSSTTDCTVQRSCVDERLTGKCIEYHNDQWFEFTPKTSGRYFVNIGGGRNAAMCAACSWTSSPASRADRRLIESSAALHLVRRTTCL